MCHPIHSQRRHRVLLRTRSRTYLASGLSCVFCAVVIGNGAHGQPVARDRTEAARQYMVDSAVVAGGIRDSRVIDSMRAVPRHEFIAAAHRRNAYFDMALPIGGGQTISPPYVVAFMTEALRPKPTDRVLEIGTGSGYQAAVLSSLVEDVYSIEIVESLGKRAAQTLRRLDYDNVHTKIGDGYRGWAEHAPYDKIIVTCSPESIPQPLQEQLVEGGRMVIPLGERFQQSLFLFRKKNGKLEKESLEATFFVPMTGQAENQRQHQIDEATPRLKFGSFEEVLGESLPRGWFYARQVLVTDEQGATEGSRAVVFSNTTPGRPAHIMQAFGVDGRVYSKMKLRFDAKSVDVTTGRNDHEQAGAAVEFYGERRAAVGSKTLAGMRGSFDWQSKSYTITVPSSARLGIVGLGLFGATGTLAFDNVELETVKSRKRERHHR